MLQSKRPLLNTNHNCGYQLLHTFNIPLLLRNAQQIWIFSGIECRYACPNSLIKKKKKMHVLIQPLVYFGRSASNGQDPLGTIDNVRQTDQGGAPNLLS